MMYDIYLALSELKLVYKYHEKRVTFATERLYQQFIELSPLLPPPPMRPLGLLVLLPSSFGLQDISCQIIRPCQPSRLKHLIYKSCGKNLLLCTHHCVKKNSGFSLFYILFHFAIRESIKYIRKPSQPSVIILTLAHNLDRHDLS